MDKLGSSSKRRDVVFRFQPMASTSEGVVLDYLKSSDAANQLVLQALKAYWLPYAYRERGFKKPSELKKVAQEMVWALESHIWGLCIDFGIERNVSTSMSNSGVSIASKSVASSHHEEQINNDSGVMGALASAATFQFNTSGL
ncbi:MAG: hypothetical protein Fur006_66440 [Coleofasciculaceae cyanobacterium]